MLKFIDQSVPLFILNCTTRFCDHRRICLENFSTTDIVDVLLLIACLRIRSGKTNAMCHIKQPLFLLSSTMPVPNVLHLCIPKLDRLCAITYICSLQQRRQSTVCGTAHRCPAMYLVGTALLSLHVFLLQHISAPWQGSKSQCLL